MRLQPIPTTSDPLSLASRSLTAIARISARIDRTLRQARIVGDLADDPSAEEIDEIRHLADGLCLMLGHLADAASQAEDAAADAFRAAYAEAARLHACAEGKGQ